MLKHEKSHDCCNYEIYPSVGVARLGNSNNFCLVPNEIGGLPLQPAIDMKGIIDTTQLKPIDRFKDDDGKILRQGQLFKIIDKNGKELDLSDKKLVKKFEWKVHLANKKSAWYKYSELRGNLMLGINNSYSNREVELRNANITDLNDRKKLIIDPGYRTISNTNDSKSFSFEGYLKEFKINESDFPSKIYPEAQFLTKNVEYLFKKYGIEYTSIAPTVESLGDIKTDKDGNLIVLGGFGRTTGTDKIAGYGGADYWWDDISDGPVTCKITLNDEKNTECTLKAWIIVGSPDFAPQITNISTLSDTMKDVGIRFKNLCPDMINQEKYKEFNINDSFEWKKEYWNQNYKAEYYRDIKPIFERMRHYQWVANVQPMMNFAQFSDKDLTDMTENGKSLRTEIFSFFREIDTRPPSELDDSKAQEENINNFPQEILFKDNQLDGKKDPLESLNIHPLMPLNSGSNSVRNQNVQKFLALDRTQMFCLEQWALGKFDVTPEGEYKPLIDPKHEVSVGNCNGLPMSPGIEVTWSVQNPNIYDDAFKIKDAEIDYNNGLSLDRDECEFDNHGCEPGDLTKRMACPWQADFVNCTVQHVNFSDFRKNKNERQEDGKIIRTPKPPVYQVYWWPPQSPWDVLTGDLTEEQQKQGHLPSGLQVNFQRGLTSYDQMVAQWHSLGFIRNINSSSKDSRKYPFFVETERNHAVFEHKQINVASDIFGDTDVPEDENPLEVFYLKEEYRPNSIKVHDIKTPATTFISKLKGLIFEKNESSEGHRKNVHNIFEILSSIKEHDYLSMSRADIEDNFKDREVVRIKSIKSKLR